MIRHRTIGIVIGALILLIAGCTDNAANDEKKAETYIEGHRYNVLSREGLLNQYVLTREKLYGSGLESAMNMQTWGVQLVPPDAYIGKEITEYGFTVNGHPLEATYRANIQLVVLMSEGKVIGGTSFPVNEGEEMRIGAPYSVEGRTLEEVTGLSYKEWVANWNSRYGPPAEPKDQNLREDEIVTVELLCHQGLPNPGCVDWQSVEPEPINAFIEAVKSAERMAGQLNYMAQYDLNLIYRNQTTKRYHIALGTDRTMNGLLVDLENTSQGYSIPAEQANKLRALVAGPK
ncbi:hypothetical protein ACFFSY_11655 [Paenibacillus aurantiacus]|uniref:DUF4825 domain-containing protein n=1 Tax=Paenibacillus aurantiacus TaxID=1936118 RepID=A0ABV5KMX8_9BACL